MYYQTSQECKLPWRQNCKLSCCQTKAQSLVQNLNSGRGHSESRTFWKPPKRLYPPGVVVDIGKTDIWTNMNFNLYCSIAQNKSYSGATLQNGTNNCNATWQRAIGAHPAAFFHCNFLRRGNCAHRACYSLHTICEIALATPRRTICEIATRDSDSSYLWNCFSSDLRSQSEATVSCGLAKSEIYDTASECGDMGCTSQTRFENLQVANIMKMTIASWDIIIIIIITLPSTSSKPSWS